MSVLDIMPAQAADFLPLLVDRPRHAGLGRAGLAELGDRPVSGRPTPGVTPPPSPSNGSHLGVGVGGPSHPPVTTTKVTRSCDDGDWLHHRRYRWWCQCNRRN